MGKSKLCDFFFSTPSEKIPLLNSMEKNFFANLSDSVLIFKVFFNNIAVPGELGSAALAPFLE